MVRTQFGKRDSLRLEQSPGAVAIFSSPRDSSTATVPGSRLITVPSGSTWKTGLHWHEEYDETVRVVQGKAAITVFWKSRQWKGHWDVVIEEWVDPEDGFKAVFFYNVIGALLEADSKPGFSDFIQMGTTLAYVDEFPAFMPGPFMLKYAATHAALATVSCMGWALGYQPWIKEYTPEHLWDTARTRGGRREDTKAK